MKSCFYVTPDGLGLFTDWGHMSVDYFRILSNYEINVYLFHSCLLPITLLKKQFTLAFQHILNNKSLFFFLPEHNNIPCR